MNIADETLLSKLDLEITPTCRSALSPLLAAEYYAPHTKRQVGGIEKLRISAASCGVLNL